MALRKNGRRRAFSGAVISRINGGAANQCSWSVPRRARKSAHHDECHFERNRHWAGDFLFSLIRRPCCPRSYDAGLTNQTSLVRFPSPLKFSEFHVILIRWTKNNNKTLDTTRTNKRTDYRRLRDTRPPRTILSRRLEIMFLVIHLFHNIYFPPRDTRVEKKTRSRSWSDKEQAYCYREPLKFLIFSVNFAGDSCYKLPYAPGWQRKGRLRDISS